MALRQYYQAAGLSEVTTTSSAAWSDLVSLTFTPDASSDYIVFWSGQFANSTNTSADYRLRLTVGGVEAAYSNNEQRATTEYASHGGMIRIQAGGSPVSTTVVVQIQAETATNTIRGKNGRLVALKLGANDVYAESMGLQTTTLTSMTTAVSATFTPPSGGDYLILGTGFTGAFANTVPTYVDLFDGSTATAQNGSAPGEITTAPNLVPSQQIWKRTLAASSQTISFRYRSHTGGSASTITDARLLCLRLDDFDAAYYTETGVDNSGTQNTYTPSLTLTETASGNPLLVLGQWHTASTTSAVLISSQLTAGGATLTESLRRSYNAAAVRPQGSFAAAVETPSAGSRTWTIDRKSPDGVASAIIRQNSGLAVLDLGSAGAGSASVTANNASHGHSVTSPTLAAKSSVAPANATHGHSSTSPAVSAKSAISPANALHGHTATSPSLTAYSPSVPAVTPASATHGHAATSPTVAANSTLAPASAFHGLTSTSPTIGAKSSIAPANVGHGLTSTQPTVSAKSTLAPANASHGHGATSPTVAAKSVIVPASATQGHSAGSPTVSVAGAVAVDSGQHGHAATSPVIAAKSVIAPASAAHGHTATVPTVAALSTVSPNDAVHAHQGTASSVGFTTSVHPDSAEHGHTAAGPVLAFTALVSPESALHGHGATSPAVVAFGGITVRPPPGYRAVLPGRNRSASLSSRNLSAALPARLRSAALRARDHRAALPARNRRVSL